jgi:NET1-associated nuclear protein 1 (U3 small nucleolar RNA-associated protein 17)
MKHLTMKIKQSIVGDFYLNPGCRFSVTEGPERFLVLPNTRHVHILALRTGKLVAKLIAGDESVRFRSVVDQQNLVLAGSDNGKLLEYSIENVTLNVEIPPQRVIQFAKGKYSVEQLVIGHDKVTLYAILVSNKQTKGKITTKIVSLAMDELRTMQNLDVTDKLQVVDSFKSDIPSSENWSYLSVESSPSVSMQKVEFLVFANSTSLKLYSDQIEHQDKDKKYISFDNLIPAKDPLSCCQVAPNGADIACGHKSGAIRVFYNVLGLATEYIQQQKLGLSKRKHPAHNVIVRKIHWHAHPVASVAYDSSGESMLYSGGEESVLVTWQLALGSYKPAHVLPRIAFRGISQLLYVRGGQATGEDDSLIVMCGDNSVQCFEPHNHHLIWKLQGLAAIGEQIAILPLHRPTMIVNPRSSTHDNLILSGLPGAPGYIHWYDPKEKCVVKALEVAPFNRVSRTEKHDSPMPSPIISHAVWSHSGSDMITVDIVPTENACVGKSIQTKMGAIYGSVTTLRFWSVSPKDASAPYELTAAMAHPHGTGNLVSALCMSTNGLYACTVSSDENAFRIWSRTDPDRQEQHRLVSTSARLMEWTCRCKVTIPSGYSNHKTGSYAADFSSDDSVLAIAFGNMLTLWDHHELTLLSSIWHDDTNKKEGIHSVQFLTSTNLYDSLLLKSSAIVSLHSPYGDRGPADSGWTFIPDDPLNEWSISCAEFLPLNEIVAIALHNRKNKKSRIVFVDALSGAVTNVVDDIDGAVSAFASIERKVANANKNESLIRPCDFCLYVLTSTGELLAIDDVREKKKVFIPDNVQAIGVAPTLSFFKNDTTKKRKISVLDIRSEIEQRQESEIIASLDSETTIPLLRSFSGAFLGRHLLNGQY